MPVMGLRDAQLITSPVGSSKKNPWEFKKGCDRGNSRLVFQNKSRVSKANGPVSSVAHALGVGRRLVSFGCWALWCASLPNVCASKCTLNYKYNLPFDYIIICLAFLVNLCQQSCDWKPINYKSRSHFTDSPNDSERQPNLDLCVHCSVCSANDQILWTRFENDFGIDWEANATVIDFNRYHSDINNWIIDMFVRRTKSARKLWKGVVG